MSRASDKDGKNAGLSMNTSHGTRHIFHSNLLQIIIVFCPSAQTQINFLIKQVWFRHLLWAAPICLFLSLSSKHINKHRKEEAFGIVYITPFRFILVIKSYTFAFCIFLYRIPDQYNRWYWVRCLAFCRHIYFFSCCLLPAQGIMLGNLFIILLLLSLHPSHFVHSFRHFTQYFTFSSLALVRLSCACCQQFYCAI